MEFNVSSVHAIPKSMRRAWEGTSEVIQCHDGIMVVYCMLVTIGIQMSQRTTNDFNSAACFTWRYSDESALWFRTSRIWWSPTWSRTGRSTHANFFVLSLHGVKFCLGTMHTHRLYWWLVTMVMDGSMERQLIARGSFLKITSRKLHLYNFYNFRDY